MSHPLLALVMILCIALSSSSAATKELITVAIDPGLVSEQDYRELDLLSLQRKLALRLTHAGFAVLSLQKEPRVVLRLQVIGQDLVVQAITNQGQEERRISRGEIDSETFHLQVLHKCVEAVRHQSKKLPTEPPPQQTSTAPTSAPTSRSTPTKVVIRSKAARLAAPLPEKIEIDLAGALMAIYRAGGVDPHLRVSGRLGRPWGPGLRGSFSFTPSVGDQILVLDFTLQAGLSWRFLLNQTMYLDTGLLLGMLQHIFFSEQGTDASGVHLNFISHATLELGWRVHSHFSLLLWILPGLSSRGRTHRLDQIEIWSRAAFQLEGGVGLAFIL